MSEIQRKQIQTAIYSVGGAASKLVSKFELHANHDELNHLTFNYIDTSASDITEKFDTSKLFLIRNMDGGGKDRRVTYEQTTPHLPEIFQKFTPKDFNIVVFSASGGSGSSIGPAIVNKLLEEGKHVITIVVGSIGSKKEVENTIGTIMSAANFANRYQRPLMMYYRENNNTTPRSKVDTDVQSALFLFSLLFSSENKGLDTADLRNLIDYHKVTSFKPELSSFDFHCGKISLPDGLVAQSAAVLFAGVEGSADEEEATPILEYRAEGFLNDKRTKQIGDKTPLYCVSYTGDFVERVKYLEALKARFEAAELSRKNEVKSVNVTESTDDGMVF